MELLKNISSTELIIILLLLIVIFGNKRVSDLAKKSGDTIKEAKKIKDEILEELGDDLLGKPPDNPPQG